MSVKNRLMFVSDNHGDECDTDACRRVLEFKRDFRPQYAIHGGDNWDIRWLRKSASKEEQEGRITDDLNAGCEFVKAYRPTHFLWGNHDMRVKDKLDATNDGKMEALCSEILSRMNAAIGDAIQFDYGKRCGVLKIDEWKFMHGFGAGIHSVRDHAQRYGSCVLGHLHRVERLQAARHDPAIGLCAGCLCHLDLSYNRSQLNTLAQSQGFVYGEKRGGRWIMQHEVIA